MMYITAIFLALIITKTRVTAMFAQTPESVTAFLGGKASFNCTTDGSHLLVWTVDGIEARFPEVRNRSITAVYSGANSEKSTLTVLASTKNNNSEIFCIQQNVMTGEELGRTEPVYLYVQGISIY